MAGIDGEFRCDTRDVEMLRALSPVVTRRSRKMSVRWRLSLADDGLGYFRLDGNGYRIDMLLERLTRDLPTAAEVLPSWRQPAGRRRIASGFVDVMVRWRFSMYDRYGDANHVPRLHGKSRPTRPTIFEIFPRGRNSDLWPRLAATEHVLASWLMHEVPAEVAIEELHTAAELLLRRFWGRAKSASFAQLVEHADSLGLLGPPHVETPPSWSWEGTWLERDAPTLLVELKDKRKHSKHRGATDTEEWLADNFWPAAQLLEHLALELDVRARR